MSNDQLHARGKTLEDLFFEQLDRKKIEALRARAAAEEAATGLSASTGIDDPELLRTIVGLGVTPDTLAAFALVPLLFVAWADGLLDEAERRAVLVEATAMGLREGSPGHELLQGWLTREPNGALFDAWQAFHVELARHLSDAARASFRSDLQEKAGRIARASGGFLGLGSVSEVEQAALDRLAGLLA